MQCVVAKIGRRGLRWNIFPKNSERHGNKKFSVSWRKLILIEKYRELRPAY